MFRLRQRKSYAVPRLYSLLGDAGFPQTPKLGPHGHVGYLLFVGAIMLIFDSHILMLAHRVYAAPTIGCFTRSP